MGKMNTKATYAAALLAAVLAASASAMHPAAPILPASERPVTRVILDPGHGGDDLGAVTKGLREKDIALVFAQKLKGRLTANTDLSVVLTRSDDTYVALDERMVDSVDWSGSIFISFHLNKVRGKKVSGAVVYSYGPERRRAWRKRQHPGIPPMPAPPRGQATASERLARAFTRRLREDGFRAEPAKSDYYVLKNPASPSVLIELGYLNNPDEAAQLSDSAYQDKMVQSLARAIEEYAIGCGLRIAAASKAVSKP